MRWIICYSFLFLYHFLTIAQAAPVTLYMPEGYVSDKGIEEFVAVLNTSDKAATATISIYYEDSNFAKFTREFPAKRRDGFSLKEYAKKDIGFSTVIESSENITATLVHYDNGRSLGADFTPTLSRTWYLAGAYKIDDQVDDYLSIFNPNSTAIDVVMTLMGQKSSKDMTLRIEAKRRYSFYLHNALGNFTNFQPYGIKLEAANEFVASLSHYDQKLSDGVLIMGHPTLHSEGYVAEGYISNTGLERVNVLNPNPFDVEVELLIYYNDGAKETIKVPGNAPANKIIHGTTVQASLKDLGVYSKSYFMTGYRVVTDDTSSGLLIPTGKAKVAVDFHHYDMQALTGVGFTAAPSKNWEFSEGFHDNNTPDRVKEFLLILNPTTQDTNVTITVYYSDGGSPSVFGRSIKAGKKEGWALHETAEMRKKNGGIWYGIAIESTQPIIPFFTHYDKSFGKNGSGFALSGTPK